MIALLLFLFITGGQQKTTGIESVDCAVNVNRDTYLGVPRFPAAVVGVDTVDLSLACNKDFDFSAEGEVSVDSRGCLVAQTGNKCTQTLVACEKDEATGIPPFPSRGFGAVGHGVVGPEKRAPQQSTWKGKNYTVCGTGYQQSADGQCVKDEHGVHYFYDGPDGGFVEDSGEDTKSSKVTVIDSDGSVMAQYRDAAEDAGSPVIVTTEDGTKSVLLNYAEYAHLKELRKAVVDEEKRLAVKYGAKPSCWDDIPKGSKLYCYDGFTPDHYEYHGQFLLIEKGKQGE